MMRIQTRLMTLVLLFMAGVFLQSHAHASPNQTYSGNISFQVIHEFYAARDHKPLWIRRGQLNRQAKKIPEILSGAFAHGLDPKNYGLDRMNAALERGGFKRNFTDTNEAELFWTHAIWRYGSDLLGGTMDAETLDSVIRGDVEDNLEALAPDQPLYRALQAKLSHVDAGLSEGDTHLKQKYQTKFSFGRRIFRPGMAHDNVPALRTRLRSYGSHDGAPHLSPEQERVYDEHLVGAVKKFQEEHGLGNDGAIGPNTLSLLNRPLELERRQIIANMQRLREPHRRMREPRRIEVSIARYELFAFERGKEVLTMPVIVGRNKRQTISFKTEISGVRLNPTWTVPKTIKREDMIPLLVNDPERLVQKYGLKIVHNGQSIDPREADWSQMSDGELASLGMWRPAGRNNPLGLYRVIMENPYDIYLHDTNNKSLFKKSMRAASSGCVRVADPEALTAFILKGKKGWSEARAQKILAAGKTYDVVIENKIPIYLDYMTAWLNDRDQLILGLDIYALDKPRYDAMAKDVLTNQRNAQIILDRAKDILEPELKEANITGNILTHTSN